MEDSGVKLPIEEHLQRILAKVCVVRITIMALLLIPLGMAWLWEAPPQGYFKYLHQPLYAGVIIVGFGLNIFYLLFYRRSKRVLFLFRFQLFVDIILASVLVLLTGGLRSGFVFLYLALTFYSGRILGMRTSIFSACFMAAILAGIGLWQYNYPLHWNQWSYSWILLAYSYLLQILALGLVLALVRFGDQREEHLLADLADKERSLKHAEWLKAVVFDWMDSGLLVIGQDGLITAVNRKAVTWADLKIPEEALGKPLHQVYPELFRAWNDYGEVGSMRLEVERPAGKGVFGAALTPLPEGMGSLILFTDITRLRRLESKIRRMERMAAVGELASGLAHEIRNPLAGIKAGLQLLGQVDLDQDQAQRLGRVVRRDIDRLDGLLRDFLVFAKPTESKPEPVRIGEVVRESLTITSPRHPDVEVLVDEGLDGIEWKWDKGHLHQVVMNLLINAMQAVDGEQTSRVSAGYEVNGEVGCLVIKDSGPGIDEGLTNRLFDPFFTTKTGGTGLGLAIAHRLCGQNFSWLELSNAPEGGAEARVYYDPNKISHEESEEGF